MMTFNVSEICSSDSHSSDLTSCHFSKSALLATSSSDQTIKIWSVGEENQELHEIATLKGHKYGVNFCQFSPQGTLLASGSTDSTTIIWDVKTGDNLCTLVQPSGFAVRVCKFCPNSAFLATAGDDDLVCIWDISVKQLVRTITSHQATIFSLDFSPDGHILISSDVEGRCRVWATQPGHHTLLAGVEEAHDLGVTCVCFSPVLEEGVILTKYRVATCGNDGYLCVWGVEIGVDNTFTIKGRVYAHEGSAMCVDHSDDGTLLATSGGDKLVKIWTVEDLTCLSVLHGHARYVTACAFSKDGMYLATGSNDKFLKIWDLGRNHKNLNKEENATSSRSENYFQLKLVNTKSKNKMVQTLVKHNSDVNTCDFYGQVLATGSADTTVRLWEPDIDTGVYTETRASPLSGHKYSVYSVKFALNGNLVSASLDGSLILWEVETGEKLKSFFHPEKLGFRVARISTDLQIVVAGGDDNCAHVWKLASNTVQALSGHENTVFAVDLSTNGKLVATGCSGGTLRVWSVETGQAVVIVDDAHDMGITSCAFKYSEDDLVEIVTAGNDTRIKVWNFQEETRELILKTVLNDHSAPVMNITFDNTGNFLSSTSGDKTVRIWETESYKCTVTLGPAPRYVTSGAFSSNLNIFAATFDKFVGLWHLESVGKVEFETIAAHDWSHQQVRSWLLKIGFERHQEKFSKISGSNLIDLSSEDIIALGVREKDVEEILQNIQWIRFGSGSKTGFVDEVPDEFLCPITYDLMTNPVKCADGFVYEETAINEWFLTKKNTSPMTNLELEDVELVPCLELKIRIENFRNSG